MLREGYIELGELCRVHRGQVTGANRVWIAGPHSADLPTRVLFRTVTRARELFKVDGVLADASVLRDVIDLPADLDILTDDERKTVQRFLRYAKKAVQLRRSGNQFFVPVQAMSLPTELLLDTGTNLTNLSWGTWQQLSQRWTPASIIDGVVRAGVPSPPAFLVCLPDVSIGSVAIADQAVRIQRPVESGAFSTEQFAGILGPKSYASLK
jgi:hypothetical protein